jgi:predicted amidohydrolase YtcJ
LRQRIEHAQILREKDIPRFSQLNIIASMQPLHIAEDVKIAQIYLGERCRHTYPIRSLLDSGCRVVFGSDMPVADPDPLKGICAAIGRRYQLDLHEPSWQPEQCISVRQALAAYTRIAAYASYEETLKGTLTPGKLADMMILNTDLEQADEHMLQKAKIEMTVLGGKIVFQAEEARISEMK